MEILIQSGPGHFVRVFLCIRAPEEKMSAKGDGAWCASRGKHPLLDYTEAHR